MKRNIALLCFFLVFSVLAFSQSSQNVTRMLETESVTVSQSAYFAACSLNLIEDSASETAALEKLSAAGLWNSKSAPNEKISFKQLAGLCADVWKIKGGLLYLITHADRYAFRELQYRNFIDRNADPSSFVSGREALRLFMKCEEFTDGVEK